MSLFVWGLSKLFSKGQVKPQNFIYWIGIVGAALVFGAAHLQNISIISGTITPLLFIITLFSNGLAGVAFGYLYWKKGLEYAMLFHVIADIMLHVIAVPFLS